MSAGALSVIVFDVNETLSDMAPLAARFAEVGAPGHAAGRWFAMLLRDGFALAAAGARETFGVLGEGTLRTVLSAFALDRDLDAAVRHVLAGFGTLPVHPDVPDGVRALRAAGYRLVTLTNGSVAGRENLLERAGIGEEFEAVLPVDDAGAWKPVRGAYAYAAQRCGVRPDQMVMVAVHPWDIDGAARAGLRTTWIDRSGSAYPSYFTPPGHVVAALTDLPAVLAASNTFTGNHP